MANTSQIMDTQSFAAGFITATIFFLLPILLVPSIRAVYVEPVPYDISTQDIDTDGVDDAYDADFEAVVSPEEEEENEFEAVVSPEEEEGEEEESEDVYSSEMHEAAPSICEDGIDNDGDGPIDAFDSDCDEGISSSSSVSTSEDCDDGVDNDGDGDIDGNDSDCA